MKRVILLSVLIFILLMQNVSAEIKPIYQYPRIFSTITGLEAGKINIDTEKILRGIDAVTWLDPDTETTRYFLFDYVRNDTSFKIRRLNPEFIEEATLDSGIVIRQLAKPQILVNLTHMLIVARLTNGTITGFLYNVLNNSLSPRIIFSPPGVIHIAISDTNVIMPSDFGGGVQSVLLKQTTSSVDICFNWFKDGEFTGTVQCVSAGPFNKIVKPFIFGRDGRCTSFATDDCIFSILYFGRPSVDSQTGFWVREYRKGLFGLEFRDFILFADVDNPFEDWDIIRFRDPVRNFIIFTRALNGFVYTRFVYDLEFNLFESFEISTSAVRSPVFTREPDSITVNSSVSGFSVYEFNNIKLPNQDKAFFSNEINTFTFGSAACNINVSYEISISNSTFSETRNYQKIYNSFSCRGGLFPIFTSIEINISTFKNQTVNVTVKDRTTIIITGGPVDTNRTIGYFGFPRISRFVYTINAKNMPFVPGAEVGFYLVPLSYQQDYFSYRVDLNIMFQDVEFACVCEPFVQDVCVNSTHRRFVRFCQPVGCADTVKFEPDPTCAAAPPTNISLPPSNLTQPLLNITEFNVTGPATGAFILLALFSTPIMIATLILIGISAFVGYKAGMLPGAITALILIMMYAMIGIYPIWVAAVLIILAAIITAFILRKWFGGEVS